MPKIVNTALKAKAKAWTFEAKAIKCGLEAPRGQGLASIGQAWPRGLHHCMQTIDVAKLVEGRLAIGYGGQFYISGRPHNPTYRF